MDGFQEYLNLGADLLVAWNVILARRGWKYFAFHSCLILNIGSRERPAILPLVQTQQTQISFGWG